MKTEYRRKTYRVMPPKYDKVCEVCSSGYKHWNPQAKFCSDKCRKYSLNRRQGRENWQMELSPSSIGSVSELVISADLITKGFDVFRAVSPSCFCDLVAIKNGFSFKVEVRTGNITTGSDMEKLSYAKKMHGEIDYIAVYAPANKKIYYFDSKYQKALL